MAERINPAETWVYRGGDRCADFFTRMIRAFAIDVPADGRLLEIGCAEFDWLTPARQSWPAMAITGIDWRARKQVRGVAIHAGDVMTAELSGPFDWIVSVSAIEHIGLGHYEKDPARADGDSVTLRRCWDWLAPGGWLTFDVPWNAGDDAFEVVRTSHRVYDDATVQSRLAQGLPWRQAWTGCALAKGSDALVDHPTRLNGGESFYYRGFCWQKPHAD